MQTGTLVYLPDRNRMDVCFPDGGSYGGLHCGQTFSVYINRLWIPTRIEYGEEWHLVGIQKKSMLGLSVKI